MMMMTMKTPATMGTIISKVFCVMMVLFAVTVTNQEGTHAKKNDHDNPRNKIKGASSSTTIATPTRRRQSVQQHRIDNHVETSTEFEFEFGRSSSSLSSSSVDGLLQEVMDKEE
mmetsp:Transcript_48874/g.118329  ORF Transcript_48874/g.118329 Transcript_48874/m.118329 type:complete len:114 (-) Transcript_48874:2111-2452(-)